MSAVVRARCVTSPSVKYLFLNVCEPKARSNALPKQCSSFSSYGKNLYDCKTSLLLPNCVALTRRSCQRAQLFTGVYFRKDLENVPSQNSRHELLSQRYKRKNFALTSVRFMAGHAKWQNIKHIKAEKDKIKSRMCDRFARLARHAAREKGPDPKLNEKLRDIIEQAHKCNVPMSTIENAIKKGSSGKTKFGTAEIPGPGGCFIIVEFETDNVSNMRHDIKSILKKYQCPLLSGEGKWRAAFEQKGIIKVVGRTDNQPLDSEKALDSAIEAGAEDVQLGTDEEDGQKYLEFFCDPSELHSVKKELEGMSYKIEEAYVGYIPTVTVELSPEDMNAASNILAELEELDDVVRVYENIQ